MVADKGNLAEALIRPSTKSIPALDPEPLQSLGDLAVTLRVARYGVLALVVLAGAFVVVEGLSAAPNLFALGTTLLMVALCGVFIVLDRLGRPRAAVHTLLWSGLLLIGASALLQAGVGTASIHALPVIVMISLWLTGRPLVAHLVTATGALILLLATVNEQFGFVPMQGIGSPWARLLTLIGILLAADVLVVFAWRIRLAHLEALNERTRDYRDILDNMVDAFFRVDAAGVITRVSPSAQELLQLPAAQVIGRRFNELLDDPALRAGVLELESTGRAICNDQGHLLAPDGRRFWISLSAHARMGARGERLGFDASLRDLTDHKRAEDSVRRTQKMDALGQLTSGITHDFNNLLGILRGNLELLRELPAGDAREATETLDSMDRALGRARELTERLLVFSRSNPGRIEPLDPHAMLDGLEVMLKTVVSSRIEIAFDRQASWSVLAVRGDLEDAVVNLLANARDAMPGGGRVVIASRDLTLSDAHLANNAAWVPGDYVALSVTDTGVGMAPDIIERVFEPFYTTKPEGQGTGLGLSMVYGAMCRFGGDVRIESALGKGTTVTLLLPRSLNQDCAGVDRTTAQRMATGALESDVTPASPPAGARILLVEDEPDLAELTGRMLRQFGHEVDVAATGVEALDRLAEDASYDLVLSDVVMPGGVSGFDVADDARRRNPQIGVLLYSGHAGAAGSDVRGRQRRYALLRKPFRRAQLEAAVAAQLNADAAASD